MRVAVLGKALSVITTLIGRLYGASCFDKRLTSSFIAFSSSTPWNSALIVSDGTITSAISSVPSFAPPSLEWPNTQSSANLSLFSKKLHLYI